MPTGVLGSVVAVGPATVLVLGFARQMAVGLIDHLDAQLELVVGRAGLDSSLLKADPYLVTRALRILAVAPRIRLRRRLTSDIAAGSDAGVTTIGYANKVSERDRLNQDSARYVIDDMPAISLSFGRKQSAR